MQHKKQCIICGYPLDYPQALYCARCKKLLYRVDNRRNPNRNARIKALQQAWDGKCFRCYYTGVRLIEDDAKSPKYITYDHLIPRQEDNIVMVAQVMNDMKSDMSDQEFRSVVAELARCFSGEEFNENVLELKHWKR